MGQGDSKQHAARAVKFGTLGEVGPLRAVAYSSARTGGDPARGPVVITAGAAGVDQFNALTGACRTASARWQGSRLP
jgi:hypothetical protein